MKSSKSISLLIGLFSMSSLLDGQTITQAEFLDAIMRNHPLFAREALSSKIEAHGRDAYLGSKDWTISSGPSFARQRPLPPSAFTAATVERTSVGLEAQRVFWKTGGRLSLAWSTDYSNQIGRPDIGFDVGPTKFYQNNAYLTYSQPLLQNFRGELDRLGYELSQYSVAAADVQALENQEDFLLRMGLQYLDWVLLVEQTTIASERLHLAEQQLEQARKKRKANLVDAVDVLRSEDAARIAEQGVVMINAALKGKRAELAVLSRAPELNDLSPEFDLYKRVEPPGLEEAGSHLRQDARVLTVIALQQTLLERQQRGYEAMTKPQLYLNTQLTLKSGDSQFGDAFGLDKSDLGVSLQFSYPLGNRSARNRVSRTALRMRQVELAEEELALNLEAKLQNLLIQLAELEKVLDLNQKQIETAKLKTREELKRYNQGRGDLTFVIQSQDNEERARLSHAQNAATYHRMNLQLKALLDELLTTDL